MLVVRLPKPAGVVAALAAVGRTAARMLSVDERRAGVAVFLPALPVLLAQATCDDGLPTAFDGATSGHGLQVILSPLAHYVKGERHTSKGRRGKKPGQKV